MAGRIREQDIALVRERSPIDSVIGEYIQLQSAGGGSMKGLCPFHDEKSPSFNVTPARGMFYCFGCGEGGDVISFLQKIDHLSFSEAVERLAGRAGVELTYEQGGYTGGGQRAGQRARLVEAHKAAAEFYAERLAAPEAMPGRRFLSERGFEKTDAERFGVGYAPAEWEALVRHLRGRGFTDKELISGGLAKEGRRGPMDRFRGRLIWPIRDLAGDVIGFGARKLDENDDGPKYLNTPESPIYKKSTVLYGVDLAKKDIARSRQAVIVEGYTDVMACHLAGVLTALATCGTSFGDEHTKILRRLLMDQSEFRGEVVFTFDGDAAGQKAALRAFEHDEKFVSQTFVAIQADGLDPCDLRLKQGDAAVRDLVATRVPLFEFKVRSIIERYDLNTNEGRLAALDAAAPVIAGIKDEGLRKRYAVDFDRWTGFLDEQFVLQRIREVSGGSRGRQGPERRGAERRGTEPEPRATERKSPGPAPGSVEARLEYETLKLAVQNPALIGPGFDSLPPEAFASPPARAVRDVIAAAGGTVSASDAAEWAARLRELAPDDVVRDLITRLAVEPPQTDENALERYAALHLARIQEVQITREITGLKSRLQRLNAADNDDEYNRLFGDLVALEQRKRLLREQAAEGF